MFQIYNVKINFKNRLMAGVPANPKLIGPWLEARKATDAKFSKMEQPKSLSDLEQEVITELPENIPEEGDYMYLVFKRNQNQELFVESYQVKAHLKDSCRVLGQGGIINIKALRSKFADRCFIEPEHIYISNSNGRIKGDPPISGEFDEHPVHVMTAQGPRSALKANEFVEGATIEFDLQLLDDGMFDIETLIRLFRYGSRHGFLAERGRGYGKYNLPGTFTITKGEKIED